MTQRSRLVSAGVALIALQACTVGPNYVRPTAPTSATFKEAAPGGVQWTPAQPADGGDRGAWWAVFRDPVLDGLERRVEVNNQNLKAQEAAYRASVELISQDRASAYPTAGLSGSYQRSQSGGSRAVGGTIVGGSSSTVQDNFSISGSASWAPDLWGRIRRTVEADRANAQATAADLANLRLSNQAALAADYFQLRVLDQQRTLYTETVAAFRRTLTITQNRYRVGVAARGDVVSAETQVRSAEATAIDIEQRRQQLEHALANLVGVAPADLTIAPVTTALALPPIAPAGLPSTLLERRPDIASAERAVAAANAQIGIATAAYFPDLTLSADGGFSSSTLGSLFNTASSFWSLGANVAESVIDFGARRARVREARARYDQAVATYRQTVLNALQGVEDQLVAARVLQEEAIARADAERLARQAEAIALNQYRSGLVDFTTVITAQAQALSAAQSVLTVRSGALQASVGLIQNLGGGWTAADLPNPKGRIGFP